MSRKTTVDELRGLMLQNTKAALESIESLRSENARLRVALTEAKTELHLRAVDALKPDPRVAVLERLADVAVRWSNGEIDDDQLERLVITYEQLIAAQRGEG